MSEKPLLTNPRRHWVLASLHWVLENSNRPYIKVLCVEGKVRVPMAYAKREEVAITKFSPATGATLQIGSYEQAPVITLDITAAAISRYVEGEHSLSFSCRFNGVVEHLDIPYDYIVAIFAADDAGRMYDSIPVDVSSIPNHSESSGASQVQPPAPAPAVDPGTPDISITNPVARVPHLTRVK
jgi:stringent starvation protein B